MAQANLQELRGQNTAPATQNNQPPNLLQLLSAPNMRTRVGHIATKYVTPERMLSLVCNAIRKTPLLAQCDQQSVIGSLMASAALGLEPNTPEQQAFLIPYKTRRRVGNNWVDVYECQFQIGARGYVTLAYRSGVVISIDADGIHEKDYFKNRVGTDGIFAYEKELKERGPLIGAFCYTKLIDGGEAATVLPLEEIHKSRARSETYKALVRGVEEAATAKDKEKAEKKLAETPWVMFEDDMAAKTAIKKHIKRLPKGLGDQVRRAIDLEDGAINPASMADPESAREIMETGVDNNVIDVPMEADESGERSPPPAQPTNNDGGMTDAEKAEAIAREQREAAGEAATPKPDRASKRGNME